MKVVWTPEAAQDRGDIWDYIAADNPNAAARMDTLFSNAGKQLANYPEMGRKGKIAGTRELFPYKHYRLVYEIDGVTVWVLTFVRTARQCPPHSRLMARPWRNGTSWDTVCPHGNKPCGSIGEHEKVWEAPLVLHENQR